MERSFILPIRVAIVTLVVIFSQNMYAESPTSDNDDLLVSPSFITISGNALIAGDDSQAQLLDNSDQMELDLSDVASLGANYTVRWRKDADTSSDPVNVVEETANAAAEIPFTSTNTSFYNAVFQGKTD